MLFQRVGRTDPEKIFAVVYNSYSTASLTNGQAVMWDHVTDCDGVGVTKPAAPSTTNDGSGIAGIAAQSIAAGAYGLIQVYGYHSAVRVRSATGGSPAIAKGTPLTISAATSFALESFMWTQQTCSSTTKVVQMKTLAFALAAQASWTTKAIAAFVKAL